MKLHQAERTTLIATFCGWMLDGLDVMLFSFVIPGLIAAWRLTNAQAGVLGTSALLFSAAGGWLAGAVSDRFGRVVVLQMTIGWFAICTFLAGFTASFPQLLVVRVVQGIGFGGEWAVGSVLIAEVIRPEFRGRAVGIVQSGWAIGWSIAAICYSLCYSLLPVGLAWRTMFWIGILPAVLVFYIRKRVPEPRIQRVIPRPESAVRTGALDIFTSGLLRTTLLASLVAVGAQGGYYAINSWLPLYLKTVRSLSVLNTTGYMVVVIAGSFVGYLLAAYLTDAVGRRLTLILFAIGSLLSVVCYTGFELHGSWVLAVGFPLGFFPSGTFSPMGSFFSELFPTGLRGSGQGFSYNSGRAIGALFPALVGYLSARVPLAQAIASFAAGAYVLMVAVVLLLPETKGRGLA